MVLSAVVWHWWIGVALFLGSILTVVAIVAGYLMKVQAMKYPRKQR